DQGEDTWRSSSQEDTITWLNVNNFEGPAGRIKTIYNVQAIPTLFFIDKNGIVMRKEIGFTTQLMDNLNKWVK
ncbi:MAG: hypothetical protein AAFO07_31535, partial [Bacteroidota bacterium]